MNYKIYVAVKQTVQLLFQLPNCLVVFLDDTLLTRVVLVMIFRAFSVVTFCCCLVPAWFFRLGDKICLMLLKSSVKWLCLQLQKWFSQRLLHTWLITIPLSKDPRFFCILP